MPAPTTTASKCVESAMVARTKEASETEVEKVGSFVPEMREQEGSENGTSSIYEKLSGVSTNGWTNCKPR